MKNAFRSSSAGFTLVELMVVMTIFAILTAMIFANIVRPQQVASLDSAVSQLVADLRSQQLKAMLGESETGTDADTYGIFFSPTAYTLYRGAYTAGNGANFTVTVGPDINFTSITFPSSRVSFARQSGDVQSFSTTTNSVIVRNIQTNEEKRVSVNRYGVVTVQ